MEHNPGEVVLFFSDASIYLIRNQSEIPKFLVKMCDKWEEAAILPLHILHTLISDGLLTK
jgi:hypothetical protein